MGDMTKFNSAIEYYIFNVLLMCLLTAGFGSRPLGANDPRNQTPQPGYDR